MESMDIIGMSEAALLLQVSDPRVAHRILLREGVTLSKVSGRYVAARGDVERIARARGGKVGPGRPRKAPEANP